MVLKSVNIFTSFFLILITFYSCKMKENKILFQHQVEKSLLISNVGKINTYYQDSNKKLYAVSNEKGQLNWNIELSHTVLFIEEKENSLVFFTRNILYCVSATSGRINWNKEILVEKHKPYIDDGTITIYSFGNIYQFTLRDGEEKFHFNVMPVIREYKAIANVVLDNNVILFSDSYNKEVVSFNYKKECFLWNYKLNNESLAPSGICASKNIVLLKYFSGYNQLLDAKNGSELYGIERKNNYDITYIADSNKVVYYSNNSKIKCFDVFSHKKIYELKIRSGSGKIYSALSDEYLLLAQNSNIWMFNIDKGAIIDNLHVKEGVKEDLQFNKNANVVSFLSQKQNYVVYKVDFK